LEFQPERSQVTTSTEHQPSPADDQLDELIIQTVHRHWETTGKALLTSKLGSELTRIGAWSKAVRRITLQEYINQNLNERLRLEPWPAHPDIPGLFPKDVALEEPTSRYFEFVPPSKSIRFRPKIWRAFCDKLPEGTRRHLDIFGENFRDLPEADAAAPNTFPIEPKEIWNQSSYPDRSWVTQSIQEWAKRHSIPLTALTASPSETGGDVRGQTPQHAATLLDRICETLDVRDMSRISMPLDIIDRLRKTRV